jgi:hypothetical protein
VVGEREGELDADFLSFYPHFRPFRTTVRLCHFTPKLGVKCSQQGHRVGDLTSRTRPKQKRYLITNRLLLLLLVNPLLILLILMNTS